MKNAIPILFLLFLFSISCSQSNSNDLRKLTIEEVIERVQSNQFPDMEKVICKDQNGEIIPFEVLIKIVDQDEFASDTYVDPNGEIKEIVIRKSTEADKIAAEKLENAILKKVRPKDH